MDTAILPFAEAQQREQFLTYKEVQQLSDVDRDALFSMLRQAQQGDATSLDAVMSYVYDERPVPIEEFVLGKRYLGLRGLIPAEKIDLLTMIDHPRCRHAFIAAGKGGGKAIGVNTLIPTTYGWCSMGSIEVGTQVYDEEGRPCRVVAVSEVEHRESYRVVFDDGSEIIACDTHEWRASTALERRKYGKGRRFGEVADLRDKWDRTQIVTTDDVRASLKHGAGSNWAVYNTRPLQGVEQPSDDGLPAYALGFWLGNGSSTTPTISVRNCWIDRTIERIRSEGIDVAARPLADKGCQLFYMRGCFDRLRRDSLIGNKHIPRRFLCAPVDTRLALLAGIMDADGCEDLTSARNGYVGIELTDERLARDVRELLHGLGFKVFWSTKDAKLDGLTESPITGKPYGTCYRMYFRPDLPVFHARPATPHLVDMQQANKRTTRYVVACEPVGVQPVRCIQVDSPRHMYLCGESMIPTHNSMLVSIMLARIVYRLLCLRRPDLFYMLGPGSGIAAVNLSVSREQARDVVYAEFKARIENSPWFDGKYKLYKYHATFTKRVAVFCQSKNPTVSYGYNTFFASMDECSHMIDNTERSLAEDLAEAVFGSMSSRFPGAYKYMAISTLRATDDYLATEIDRIKENGFRIR